MMPRQVRAQVLYDNKDISADLAPYMKSISYTDHLSGEADDLTLTLEDRAGLWQGAWMPEKGATLDVSLLRTSWNAPDGLEETLPLGLFAVDEIESRGAPSEADIRATSVPENNELRGVEKTRSWEKAELKVIAGDIATGAGMELVYDAEDNPTLDRAEQTEQSDLSFLMQLCDDQGMALKICRNQIIIFDESKYEEAVPEVAIVKPGTVYLPEEGLTYITAIKGYRFRSRIRDVYRACHVECQKADTKKTIEATFTDPDKTEGKTLQVKEQVDSIAEAERLAKKRLREKNRDEVTGSFDLPGNFRLLASVTVRVVGFGAFDGNYIVETAQHSAGSGYTTSIDIRRCLHGY